MPGLVEHLARLHGLELAERYRIEGLHRIGSQFAVFEGCELDGGPVAVKLPLLDYGRPASFGLARIRAGRRTAEREWDTLQGLAGTDHPFPAALALVLEKNPLLAGRGAQAEEETFLVEEWVAGESLDDLRQRLAAGDRAAASLAVTSVARALLDALLPLRPRLFADVSPHNFLGVEGRVRLVDASSLVEPDTPLWEPGAPDAVARVTTPVTLCYLPASDVRAYREGRRRLVSEGLVLRALGKMLHEVATNLHPIEGEDPATDESAIGGLSEVVQGLLRGLLDGSCRTLAQARLTLDVHRSEGPEP